LDVDSSEEDKEDEDSIDAIVVLMNYGVDDLDVHEPAVGILQAY
jgi:hypothetical protein